MQQEWGRLTPDELRKLLLHESKKFVFALELGCSIAELEGIRTRIRALADLLAAKENQSVGMVFNQSREDSHSGLHDVA